MSTPIEFQDSEEFKRTREHAQGAARRYPGREVYVTATLDGYYNQEEQRYITWNNYGYTFDPTQYRENELIAGYIFNPETMVIEYL